MPNPERDDPAEDLSKRDRLVNAWIAAGEDASVETVASLTGASESYASQVRQDFETDGIDDDELAEIQRPDLVDQYRRQLTAAAQGKPATGQHQGGPMGQAQSGQQVGGQQGTRRQGPSPQGQHGHSQQSPQATNRSPAQAQHGQQGTRPPLQTEDGQYVPVERLKEIDATLSVIEEEASYEVQHVPPQHHQRQVALAKLYVAQKARRLLAGASEQAVPAEEL